MAHVHLVEPFFGGSHRVWAEGWRDHSRHRIELDTLEARAWRWRMRGGAITLAGRLLERDPAYRPDVIVASDMLDLATFAAMIRRRLPDVPIVAYLHENQLTYPRQPGEPLDQGLAWTTWRSLVVADRIWCNSQFHLDEVVAAVADLLGSVPDHPHDALLDEVAARMEVMPVGVDLGWVGTSPRRLEGAALSPLVVSNQRWHHDKDVGAVVRELRRLARGGVDFRVAVVGDHEGGEALHIDPVLDDLGARVVARGHLGRDAYRRLLREADIVVSAAHNEFFGIAVVEALAAGCVPVLPRRLAYPETVPAEFHEGALYDSGDLEPALRTAITDVDQRRRSVVGLAEAMRRFDWAVLAPRYDDAIDRLAVAGPAGR
ncbi:MAG: DUF3524 domain-containing protein [Acidimicrobiales bacterium]